MYTIKVSSNVKKTENKKNKPKVNISFKKGDLIFASKFDIPLDLKSYTYKNLVELHVHKK